MTHLPIVSSNLSIFTFAIKYEFRKQTKVIGGRGEVETFKANMTVTWKLIFLWALEPVNNEVLSSFRMGTKLRHSD